MLLLFSTRAFLGLTAHCIFMGFFISLWLLVLTPASACSLFNAAKLEPMHFINGHACSSEE
jgi:hypothetical protein